MNGITGTIGAVVIALGALAAIAVLGIHGTIDKAVVGSLLGSIVTGGFALAASAHGAAGVRKTIASQALAAAHGATLLTVEHEDAPAPATK